MIKLPKKKYTPKQDVQLGKEAASEVRKQYPIIEDQHIAKYLTQIGNRLVAAAPTELKQSVSLMRQVEARQFGSTRRNLVPNGAVLVHHPSRMIAGEGCFRLRTSYGSVNPETVSAIPKVHV